MRIAAGISIVALPDLEVAMMISGVVCMQEAGGRGQSRVWCNFCRCRTRKLHYVIVLTRQPSQYGQHAQLSAYVYKHDP